MIQIRAGNLLGVQSEGLWYYTVVLDRVRLFGGNLVFAFHRGSPELLAPAEVLGGAGFHAFVDFIWAKRENRLIRVATSVDTNPYRTIRGFKGTHVAQGTKAHIWFLYDPDTFEERRRGPILTGEERSYPLFSCMDDARMVAYAQQGWTPDQDSRI